MNIDPEMAKAFNIAMTIYDQEPMKARKMLEIVVKKEPNFYKALYNLGIMYSNENRIDKSAEMFEKAYSINNDITTLYNLCNQYFKLQQYDKAIEGYLKVNEDENFESVDSLYNLAFSYMKIEKYDEAIQEFYNVIYLNEINIDAWFNLAVCHYLSDKKKEAIDIFKKLLRIVPDHYHAIYNIGLIYLELEMFSKAVIYFKKYISISNKPADQIEHIKYARRRIRELEFNL